MLNYRLRQAGFTLVEVMVVVAVLAITLGIAVPSYQQLIASSRISAQSGDMLSTLQFARAEAIKRGTRVTVCKSADGLACTASGQWDSGWIVFVDPANPGVVDTGEAVLTAHAALLRSTLTGAGTVADMISYLPSGRARTGAGAMQSGGLALCGPTGGTVPGRVIAIEAGTGRPSATEATSCT